MNLHFTAAALALRRLKYKSCALAHAKIRRSRRLPVTVACAPRRRDAATLHCCLSCPNLFQTQKIAVNPLRCFSTTHTSHTNSPMRRKCVMYTPELVKYTPVRLYSKCDACCPCPFPCGPCGCKCGCGCLPPPCNTPPRCIQYMTGYYYYPYGTWFCGPYHVQGTCVPVAKPGCVPCRCCPPCCICPAASAFNPQGTASSCPGEGISSPSIYDPSRRSGLSRWLPNCFPRSPRHPIPPVISSIVCGGCGTQTNFAQQDETVSDSYSPRKQPQVGVSSNHDQRKKANRNPISHKRFRHYQCPQLDKPRSLLTKEERDHPHIRPDSFNYSTVPQFRNPYPRPYEDIEH